MTATTTTGASLVNVVRSEWIRIWRPSIRYGGIGLMAGFAALISVFIYTSLADPSAAPGPGGGPTTAADSCHPPNGAPSLTALVGQHLSIDPK